MSDGKDSLVTFQVKADHSAQVEISSEGVDGLFDASNRRVDADGFSLVESKYLDQLLTKDMSSSTGGAENTEILSSQSPEAVFQAVCRQNKKLEMENAFYKKFLMAQSKRNDIQCEQINALVEQVQFVKDKEDHARAQLNELSKEHLKLQQKIEALNEEFQNTSLDAEN
jgi:hypothetical protein